MAGVFPVDVIDPDRAVQGNPIGYTNGYIGITDQGIGGIE
jgi:hypothetical protein